jgi:hypothetical protein
MTIDGKKQRNALTAVERAIKALGAGKPVVARRAAARAVELDQLGIYAGLEEAVVKAADELEAEGSVTDRRWDEIAGVLGRGPLGTLVERLRG